MALFSSDQEVTWLFSGLVSPTFLTLPSTVADTLSPVGSTYSPLSFGVTGTPPYVTA